MQSIKYVYLSGQYSLIAVILSFADALQLTKVYLLVLFIQLFTQQCTQHNIYPCSIKIFDLAILNMEWTILCRISITR